MFNPFSLKDKNILITGASSGIGMQCAISCSKMGANIILIARNEDRLKNTLSEMKAGNHLYYTLDVKNYNEIEPVVKNAVSKIGKISGFIHSAGIEMTLPLKLTKAEKYKEIFAVNTISAFEFAKVLSKKKIVEPESSSFVFISSIMSVVANGGLTAYCASKGALISGARSMSIELAKKNIRVNCISPGYIQTEMMQKTEQNMSDIEIKNLRNNYLLGLGSTEDVANACIYFLSDASKWITGTNLIIDGGYSVK